MFQGRMFNTWKDGFLHLILSVVVPIIPIIVYMSSEKKSNSYLYLLIFTVILSLLYDFYRLSDVCSLSLKVESIISCVVLFIMLIWSIMALYTYIGNGEKSLSQSIGIADWVLLSLFAVPAGIIIIEIIRCIILDIKSVKHSDDNNLKGAAGI